MPGSWALAQKPSLQRRLRRRRGGLCATLHCDRSHQPGLVGDLEYLARIDPVGILDLALVGLPDGAPVEGVPEVAPGEIPERLAPLHSVGPGSLGYLLRRKPWQQRAAKALGIGQLLYVVEDLDTGEIQRGKLVIIK